MSAILVPASLTRARLRVLRSVLKSGDWYWSADDLAHRVGCTSRHALARRLHRCGLPPYRILMAMSRVAATHRLARRGLPMRKAARSLGMNPGWLSRASRQLTGLSWRDARSMPTSALVRLLLGRHGRPPQPTDAPGKAG